MRTLNLMELERVSGGEWEFEVDLGVTKFVVKGDESVQDMAAAAMDAMAPTYWAARDAMADFYEWVANGWNYSMACSYH